MALPPSLEAQFAELRARLKDVARRLRIGFGRPSRLTADAASYAYEGVSADLEKNTPTRTLDADAQAFTVTGVAATLNKTTVGGGNKTMPAVRGTYAMSGQSANLTPGTTSATTLTTLSLTSTVGGTLLPFTVGHAFKAGDVPTGTYVDSDIADFQCDVMNRWPDGSVKIAMLSGRRTLTANVAGSINIRRTSAAPSGTALTLAGMRAVVTGTNTLALSGFSSVDITALLNTAPYRTRATGPQMSEWHWRSAVGSDTHLVAWFYVRYYAGGQVEIETVVENGYLRVAGPANKAYTATLTLNGTQRIPSGSQSMTHCHHTRWGRVDWYGASPAITPSHNLVYLKSTKLVANAITATPTSAAWTGPANWDTLGVPATETNSGAPFSIGNYSTSYAAGGDVASIGMHPAWEMLYLSSGDKRAYDAMLVNARCFGRYPLAYRNESTQQAPRCTQFPQLAMPSGSGWDKYGSYSGDGSDTTPAPTAANVIPQAQWIDAEHQPSAPYVPYLVTGRYSFMEACQMAASTTLMSRFRNGSECLFGLYDINEDSGRVWAWGLRQAVWAATVTPDSDTTMQSEYRTIVDLNVANRLSRVTSGVFANNLGILAFNEGPESNIGIYKGNKPWMLAFFVTVLGHAYDLQINTSTTARTAHASLLTQAYKFVVGIHGTGSGFNYRRAGIYRFAMSGAAGPGAGAPFLASWDAIYAATMASANVGGTAFPAISSANGLALLQVTLSGSQHEYAISSGAEFAGTYNSQIAVPLAYAVDHGAVGAQAAYDRFVTSSTFVSYSSGYSDQPKWRIAPRGATAATTVLQTQAAALTANQWSGNFASASLNAADSNGAKPVQVLKNVSIGSPEIDHFTDWGGKGAWDSVNRRMYFLGSPNGSTSDAPSTALGVYDEATDTWIKVVNPIGVPAGHCYDNYDCDSAGTRIFKHTHIQFGIVYVANYGTGVVTNLGGSGTGSSVSGLAWFPTWGAQGSLLVCGNNAIRRYNFATASWTVVQAVAIGESAFAHYNQAADAVFCGGGTSASARVYRVSNTGAVTDLGIPPTQLSSDQAAHALVVPHPTATSMLVFDAAGNVRSMTSAGSWSVVGSVPAGLRSVDYGGSPAMFDSVATSITARGVVQFVQFNGTPGSTCKTFIYKPA